MDSRPIKAEDHQRWVESVLSDQDRLLLIGERDGNAVGVVRFDIEGEEAEVSIYLVPGGRTTGDGSALLRLAEERLVAARPDVRYCRARVLGENHSSQSLFTACGYTTQSTWYSKKLVA